MKVYQYDKRLFLIEVKVTGYFCIAVIFLCLYMALNNVAPGLMIMAALIAFYTVWNTFISHSNPEIVKFEENAISFSSFQKEDRYTFEDIKQFRIREFPSSGKMYIRINNSNLFKGRYWVQTSQFNDGKELFHKLLDMEYEMHPDTLKARARRVNTEYREAQGNSHGTGKKPRARKMMRLRKQ